MLPLPSGQVAQVLTSLQAPSCAWSLCQGTFPVGDSGCWFHHLPVRSKSSDPHGPISLLKSKPCSVVDPLKSACLLVRLFQASKVPLETIPTHHLYTFLSFMHRFTIWEQDFTVTFYTRWEYTLSIVPPSYFYPFLPCSSPSTFMSSFKKKKKNPRFFFHERRVIFVFYVMSHLTWDSPAADRVLQCFCVLQCVLLLDLSLNLELRLG